VVGSEHAVVQRDDVRCYKQAGSIYYVEKRELVQHTTAAFINAAGESLQLCVIFSNAAVCVILAGEIK
jgi:hypothetical protein